MPTDDPQPTDESRAVRPRARKKAEGDFEESLRRLEDIVKRLEDDTVPLEESLKLFTEGKKLARFCAGELQQVENRVRQLIEDSDGKLGEVPLEGAEDPAPDGEDEGEPPEAKSPSKRVDPDDLPF